MCDEITAAENERYLAGSMTRRGFGAAAGAVGIAAILPSPANAHPLVSRDVSVTTPDGKADAYFTAPSHGKHPGVIVWPDIMGLRPAFRQMADRLAQSGYAVLTVNQFYRSTKAPFIEPGENFGQPEVRARIMPWREPLTNEAVARDAKAFVAFLDAQAEVDTGRGVGVTGYCMGGPLMMRTAAAAPGRVRAGASFHGGGLVGDGPDSPDKLIPEMKARFLIAIAESDDKKAPDDKDALKAAFAAAGRPAEVEVYPGTMHGWCPPDSQVYNEAEAERAWARLLATFAARLAA